MHQRHKSKMPGAFRWSGLGEFGEVLWRKIGTFWERCIHPSTVQRLLALRQCNSTELCFETVLIMCGVGLKWIVGMGILCVNPQVSEEGSQPLLSANMLEGVISTQNPAFRSQNINGNTTRGSRKQIPTHSRSAGPLFILFGIWIQIAALN